MDEKELNELVNKTIEAVDAKVAAEQPADAAKAEEAAIAVEPKDVVTKADAEQMVKDATSKAVAQAAKAFEAKLLEQRRPVYPIPAVKSVEKEQEPTPLLWAVKAVAANPGSTIEFNLQPGRDYLEFQGSKSATDAVKAMATTASGATGEHFIPRVQTNLVIEALYQYDFLREVLGNRVYPMPGLICDAPTLGAFAAGYAGENTASTTAGDATTGRKTLTAKELTSIAKLSSALLNDSSPAIEQYVRSGLAKVIGETTVFNAFFGPGTNAPTGATGIAGVVATAIGSDNVFTAIFKALGRMATNKVSLNDVLVVMHPAVAVKAATTQGTSSAGDYLSSNAALVPMAAQGAGGLLAATIERRLGVPVRTMANIPIVTSASPILVLSLNDFTYGERQTLEISSSNVAGTSWEYNQTWIKAIVRHDFMLHRAAGLEIISGVTH